MAAEWFDYAVTVDEGKKKCEQWLKRVSTG